MESSSSSAAAHPSTSNVLLLKAPPSDRLVTLTIQRGLQDMFIQTTTGVILGGLAGIVLASRAAAAKKLLPALGGGMGLGAAWTRTSVQLEQLLTPKAAPSKSASSSSSL